MLCMYCTIVHVTLFVKETSSLALELTLVELIWLSHDHANWRFLSPFPPFVKRATLFVSTHYDYSSNGSDYAEYEDNNSSCISK